MTERAPVTVIPVPHDLDEQWAAIVAELTRRRFLGGAVGAGLGLAIVACGGEEPTATATETSLIVRDDRGRVRVPVEPRRIVCVDPYLPASLVELRAPMIGRVAVDDPRVRGIAPADIARFEAVEAVTDEAGSVMLERVALLRPDLIVAPQGLDAPIGRLADIAPTLVYSWQNAAPGDDDLFPTVRRLADAIGRTAQFDALRARYEARAAEVAAAHRDRLAAERYAVIVGGEAGTFYLFRPEVPGAATLARGGARFIPAMKPGDGSSGYIEMSAERAGALETATTIVVEGDGSGGIADATTAVLELPTMRRLRAVRDGRILPIDGLNLTSYGGAIAALDAFSAALSESSAPAHVG